MATSMVEVLKGVDVTKVVRKKVTKKVVATKSNVTAPDAALLRVLTTAKKDAKPTPPPASVKKEVAKKKVEAKKTPTKKTVMKVVDSKPKTKIRRHYVLERVADGDYATELDEVMNFVRNIPRVRVGQTVSLAGRDGRVYRVARMGKQTRTVEVYDDYKKKGKGEKMKQTAVLDVETKKWTGDLSFDSEMYVKIEYLDKDGSWCGTGGGTLHHILEGRRIVQDGVDKGPTKYKAYRLVPTELPVPDGDEKPRRSKTAKKGTTPKTRKPQEPLVAGKFREGCYAALMYTFLSDRKPHSVPSIQEAVGCPRVRSVTPTNGKQFKRVREWGVQSKQFDLVVTKAGAIRMTEVGEVVTEEPTKKAATKKPTKKVAEKAVTKKATKKVPTKKVVKGKKATKKVAKKEDVTIPAEFESVPDKELYPTLKSMTSKKLRDVATALGTKTRGTHNATAFKTADKITSIRGYVQTTKSLKGAPRKKAVTKKATKKATKKVAKKATKK